MKKIFTSMILMALVAINAMAQDLTYEVTSYVGSSYEGFTQQIDVSAVEENLGCTIAECSAFAIIPGEEGDTEDASYQTGSSTDGWRNIDGSWGGWSENAAYCVKADFLGEADANFPYPGFYYIGGHDGHGTHLTEPVTYTASYKLYNPDQTKSMKITLKLNYIERPTLNLGELTIVGQSEATITEYPRSSYKADWYGIETKDICTKLNISEEELANNISNMMFVKKLQTGEMDCMWDGSSIVSCASSAFSQILDENGNELDECGSSESQTKYWIDNVGYEADSVWVYFGQEPSACQADDQFYSYVYIVNGSNAYQLKVTLKVEPKPETGGFADMTKVGSQTITLKRDIDLGYSTTAVELNVEEIEAGLGVGLSSATFMAFSSEAKDELTDSYTTSSTGFWMDMHSIPMSWNTSAQSYFVDATLSDGTIAIGHMPGVFEGGEKADGSLFVVFGNSYYELVMDVQIGDAPSPTEYTPETCELVATVNQEYEIVPGSSYQDEYMASDAGKVDVGIEWIEEQLGGSATLYGMKENTETSTLEYSKAYSCDPNPGFWMTATVGEYQSNTATVSTWAATCTYGITYADGLFSFYQYPDTRSVGEKYESDFYLLNLSTGKKIKVHFTVSYVESRGASKNIVGNTDYEATASEEGELTQINNFGAILSALGCDFEEFEETGDLSCTKTATKYLGKVDGMYDDAYNGFPCDADGYLVDTSIEGSFDNIAFWIGFDNVTGSFFITVADETTLATKKYTGHLGFDFGDNRYICNVSFGNGETGVNAISVTNQTTGKTYNIAGQAVDGSFKGIVIRNGKKQLVK